MSKNIVYLLGAGASAGAIPTIKRLHLRMEFFFEILLAVSEKEGWDKNADQIAKYRIILKEIKQFGTPDIVARTYHLKNEYEMERFVKEFLTCYMLFEQLPIPEDYPGSDVIKNLKENVFGVPAEADGLDKLNQTLDSRYVEFFSSILAKNEHGIPKWPENIKILSWNYDLQITKALGHFLPRTGQIEVERTFKVFPLTDIKPDGETQNSAYLHNIIKLNGTAGFFGQGDNSIMDSTFHTWNKDSWKIIHKVMFDSRYPEGMTNQLEFAWSNSDVMKSAREKARNILKDSKVVVCIGYSFPNFNRLVDREIFRGIDRQYGRLYVQDIYPSDIIPKLDGLVHDLKKRSNPIAGTGSFYLPNEFWG